jgi:hypothetical protein
MRRALQAGLLLHCLAATALAQAPGKLGATVALGPAINSGTERYNSSFPMTARFAASLGLTRSIGLEAGLAVTGGDGFRGDDVVLTYPLPPGKTGFKHLGGTLSFLLAPGGNLHRSSFRLLGGAGLYRISDVGGSRGSLTRGALHLGFEQSLSSPSQPFMLYLGSRVVWFQDLGGSGAIHVPLELGVRLR